MRLKWVVVDGRWRVPGWEKRGWGWRNRVVDCIGMRVRVGKGLL